MEESTITGPTESNGSLNKDISTRRFLELGIKALLVAWATKATNVLWQALPQTYDEIMAAIAKWELSYAQLREIGIKYGSKFNDEQRKVLSGELSKLKTLDIKPKPLEVETVVAENQEAALNESAEERKERLERERKDKMAEISAKTLTDKFSEDKNWKFSQWNTLKAKLKRNWRSITIEWDENNTDVTNEAKVDFTTVLAPGNYEITVLMSAWWTLSLYIYDANQRSIDMEWKIIPEGWKKAVTNFLSETKTKVSIPDNCRSCMFQGKVTAQDRNITIESFLAEAVKQEEWLVQNK